jgi:hypothetical protein
MALVEIGLKTDLSRLANELIQSGIATRSGDTLIIHLPTAAKNLRERNQAKDRSTRETKGRREPIKEEDRTKIKRDEARISKEFPRRFGI